MLKDGESAYVALGVPLQFGIWHSAFGITPFFGVSALKSGVCFRAPFTGLKIKPK